MMRFSKWLAVIFCLTLETGLSQTKTQRADSIRKQNVHRFQDYFFCWPVIKQRSTSFEFRANDGSGRKIEFKPNNSVHLGLGLYLFEVGFEVTFAVPQNRKKNELFGESKAKDIQANILGKNWGADLFVSNYQGFYRDDTAHPVGSNQPYPQRADIHTRNVGINGIYIFNQNTFSLRSAFNYAERQKKSGGSPSLSGTFNSYRVTADSAVLSQNYDAVFGRFAGFERLHATTFSLAPGYTYSVVVRNFFLNTSLGLGPAVNWINFSLSSGETLSNTSVNIFIDFRAALGYNGDRFFTGVSLVAQSRSIKFGNTSFSSSSTTFKIVVGYRFREFGILKKRAIDLLPFHAK